MSTNPQDEWESNKNITWKESFTQSTKAWHWFLFFIRSLTSQIKNKIIIKLSHSISYSFPDFRAKKCYIFRNYGNSIFFKVIHYITFYGFDNFQHFDTKLS